MAYRLAPIFILALFIGERHTDETGNRVAKGTITGWSCDVTQNRFSQTAGYVPGPSGVQLT